MNCATARELLSERLDAALAGSAESAVVEHLARCAACAETDRRLVSLVEDLALLGNVETPAELADRLVARVPLPAALLSTRVSGSAASKRRREPHELRRVAGWAAVMLMASLALLGRDVAGQIVDHVAPVLAFARQEAARSRLSGTSPLASLDQQGAAELQRMTQGLRGTKE